jgi:hypothetical protein
VKRSRHCQERFTQQIENKPRGQQPQQTMRKLQDSGKNAAFYEWAPGQPFQARGADHLIVMLGDAFPAKKLPAGRTARDRFPLDMVEAAL